MAAGITAAYGINDKDNTDRADEGGNLEAEIGLALMFASMIPIYGREVWGNWARLFAFVTLLVFAAVTLAWWGVLAWLVWRVIWGQARG
jgi:hypothetical protein